MYSVVDLLCVLDDVVVMIVRFPLALGGLVIGTGGGEGGGYLVHELPPYPQHPKRLAPTLYIPYTYRWRPIFH